jgi:hypothetical protein
MNPQPTIARSFHGDSSAPTGGPPAASPPFVSYNFQFAKVAALFAVIAGHFAQAHWHPWSAFLWIPAQVGLAVFGFSSGYFSALRYREGFSLQAFWRAKIPRLLAPLLVADVFLLAILLVQGRENVFHWHSLPALLGLNGVFLLTQDPPQTPLGNGLWFFTLLWLFYLAFPALEKVNRSRRTGLVTVVAAGLLALLLSYRAPLGVTFWDTAWFFLFGVFCGKHPGRVNSLQPFILSLVGLVCIPISRFVLHTSSALPSLMLLLEIGVIGILYTVPLPRWGSRYVLAASALLFEMYLIHTYLFVPSTTGSLAADFLLSLVLIVCMASILMVAGKALGKKIQLPNPGRA